MSKRKILVDLVIAFMVMFLLVKFITLTEQISYEKDLRVSGEQKFTKLVDKYNQLHIKQQVAEVNHQFAIDSLIKDFHVKGKGVKSAVVINSNTGFKNKKIPFRIDTFNQIKPYYVYKDCIKERINLSDSDSWYSFKGYVDSVGLTIEKVSFIDSFLITEKKKGLFKNKIELEIVSKSPYTDITKVKSVKIKQKSRIIPAFVSGVVTGVVTFILLLK